MMLADLVNSNHVVQVDPNLLAQVGGFVVPVLVAILTKSSAPKALKAILNAVLVTIAGLVAVAVAADGSIQWTEWVQGVAWAAVTSWASYYGFYKPTGIAPGVSNATDPFGIG